ncbi:hypothetical protein BJ912DRAFT_989354 [Pholiota molesta]|nr:hypothetical protein BJ912DRAFT_989354 [Pholiota molesta]
MTNLDLLTLPQELLIRILSDLDGIALARCATTCRYIHETLKNSSLLTYIIQLHFNGVTDSGGTQRLSYPELIERLQRRRHEWMSPKWTVNMSLELDCDYHSF